MSTNFNLLFYLKEPRRYIAGSLPIYLRVTTGSYKAEISIGKELPPSLWDPRSRKAKGNWEDAKRLNHHLDIVRAKIEEVHTRMIATGEEITAQNINDAYLGISAPSKMLLEIFQYHNFEIEQLIGNGIFR